MSKTLPSLLLALCLSALPGCGGKKGTLTVSLVLPLDVDPFVSAAKVHVAVGDPAVHDQTVDVSAGHFTLDLSFQPPSSGSLVGPVVIEALAADGTVTARGRSPDLALVPIDETLAVWVAPVGRVSVAPGQLAGNHAGFAAGALPGLGALMVGGQQYAAGVASPSTSVDLFQAYTVAPMAVAPLPSVRVGPVVIPVAASSGSGVGTVAVAGGEDSGVLLGFDTGAELGAWTPLATDVNLARHSPAMTRLADGTTLLVGGSDSKGTVLDSAAVVTTSGGFTVSAVAAKLAHARLGGSVTACKVAGGDGAVVIGGASGQKPEVYLSSARTFAPLDVAVTPADGHTATGLPSGKVLVLGGIDFKAQPVVGSKAGTLVDAVAGTAVAVEGVLSTARSGHTATLLGNTLLVCGGRDEMGAAQASCDVIDVAGTPQLKSTIKTAAARAEHAAVVLPQGTVLLVGGTTGSGGTVAPINSLEIYTP